MQKDLALSENQCDPQASSERNDVSDDFWLALLRLSIFPTFFLTLNRLFAGSSQRPLDKLPWAAKSFLPANYFSAKFFFSTHTIPDPHTGPSGLLLPVRDDFLAAFPDLPLSTWQYSFQVNTLFFALFVTYSSRNSWHSIPHPLRCEMRIFSKLAWLCKF